jgi:hypothetical protein
MQRAAGIISCWQVPMRLTPEEPICIIARSSVSGW